MTDELRVALIGAGAIATQSHVPAWQASEGTRLVAVVDRSPEKAERLGRELGIEHYHSLDPVLADSGVDAVDICVPPAAHLDISLACLEAGKHVLLEKPITLDLQGAKRLIAAEQAASRTLMVAENWPFASSARKAKQLLTSGTVGDPFLLRAHHESALYFAEALENAPWLSDPAVAGRGYLLQAGIHSINLARFLVGNFESLQGFASPPSEPIEHTLVCAAEFESGALASMNFTGRSHHLGERRLEFRLFCSEGVVEFDIWSGEVRWTVGGRESMIRDGESSRGFQEEIEHFRDCVRSGRQPLTTAADQLETLATIYAVYRSVAELRPVSPRELLEEA